MSVEFTDETMGASTTKSTEKARQGLAGFLVRKHVVKTQSSANTFLMVIALVFLMLSFIIITFVLAPKHRVTTFNLKEDESIDQTQFSRQR
jgi:hypothetical protein